MIDSDFKYGHTDRASGSHRYLAPLLIRLCRNHGARSVLDIGSGNGELCRDLDAIGMRVVGLEPSRDGYEVATRRSPHIRFYQLGLDYPPSAVEEANFDAVVCAEVVEHLYRPESLPEFAAHKLNPGGLLLVTTPYHGYLKNLALVLLGKWDSHHQPLRTGGHIKFWSSRTLRRLLENSGFRVEKFVGVGRAPFLWKSMVMVARKRQLSGK